MMSEYCEMTKRAGRWIVAVRSNSGERRHMSFRDAMMAEAQAKRWAEELKVKAQLRVSWG